MSNEKTLVILIPGFPGSEAESTCLPFQQLLVKQLKIKFPALEVIVLALHYPYKKEKYDFYGSTVIPFGAANKGGFTSFFLHRKVRATLDKIYKGKNIAGILSFWMGECALLGKQFSITRDIPHYCWLMGQDAKAGNSYVRKINPAASETIALSDFLADELERNYRIRPAHIIFPGIDTDTYNPHINFKDIDIIGAGSLISLKQFHIFLETVTDLSKHFPGIRSVLCGRGPEESRLKSLAGEYGIANNIVFTGEISHAELIQLMQRSKLLLHPSSYEGFSGVCQEALYAGAHVISFTKAVNNTVKNWHIVATKEEMTGKAKSILTSNSISAPVLLRSIEECAVQVMNLFS